MRVLLVLLALVATPLVANAQGQSGSNQNRQREGRSARSSRPAVAPRAAAPAAGAGARNDNCSQQEGQHEGNNSCDAPPPPAPPPPPPPPTASCSGLAAPAGDVSITGGVFRGNAGLANWCVQLYANGVLVGDTKSNASGAYAFNSIAAGAYLVCLVVQPGFVQTFPTAMPGDPVCPGNVAGYPMPLPAGSSSPFNDFIVQ